MPVNGTVDSTANIFAGTTGITGITNISTSSDIEDANGTVIAITGTDIQIYCDKICASHTV